MGHIEELVASLLVAFTTVVLYKLSLVMLKRAHISVFLALVFAFGTSAWSTASRALWQHGPSMLMLAIALYVLIAATTRPRLVMVAGLPLALSFVIRPTNAIPILLISIYVYARHRNYFVWYLLCALPIAAGFVLYSLTIYGHPLPAYFVPDRLGVLQGRGAYAYVLAANLVSPNRGLFIFTPMLLFSVLGFVVARKNLLDNLLFALILLHWFAISSFRHWWGGWQFGPRFFTDMLPFLFYFLILAVQWIDSLQGRGRAFAVSVFLAFSLAGMFIHYRGANSWSTILWNATPVDVDAMPTRVWDWSDIQFLRPGD